MKSSDRPFPDFVGNDEALTHIAAYLRGGHFPHALMIEGPAGSGKKTLARLIAGAAVCENRRQRPCGVCASCRKAAAGTHPDIEEFSGKGGDRSFHIDTVRAMRHTAYIRPNEADARVMILCDAHTMTPQAQNALLKILEEPPTNVLFLITCENRAQLLPTVRSRTVVLSLSGVSWEQARPLLLQRLPDADEDTLRRALALSGGVIGPVLSGAAGDAFSPALRLVPQIADALTAPDDWPLIALTAGLDKEKEAVRELLSGLVLLFRDALVLHYGSKATLSPSPEAAARLSARFGGSKLSALLRETEALQQALLRNMNQTLLSAQLAARLRRAAMG